MGSAIETRRLLDTKPQRDEAKLLTRHGSTRRILVCLDRSPFSDVALRHAISMAKTLDSALTLLYVLQPAHEAKQGNEDGQRSGKEPCWVK